MCAFIVLGVVFQYQAKRLAWGNISEMTIVTNIQFDIGSDSCSQCTCCRVADKLACIVVPQYCFELMASSLCTELSYYQVLSCKHCRANYLSSLSCLCRKKQSQSSLSNTWASIPHHTTTILRPFFWDHPGEPVPE